MRLQSLFQTLCVPESFAVLYWIYIEHLFTLVVRALKEEIIQGEHQ